MLMHSNHFSSVNRQVSHHQKNTYKSESTRRRSLPWKVKDQRCPYCTVITHAYSDWRDQQGSALKIWGTHLPAAIPIGHRSVFAALTKSGKIPFLEVLRSTVSIIWKYDEENRCLRLATLWVLCTAIWYIDLVRSTSCNFFKSRYLKMRRSWLSISCCFGQFEESLLSENWWWMAGSLAYDLGEIKKEWNTDSSLESRSTITPTRESGRIGSLTANGFRAGEAAFYLE